MLTGEQLIAASDRSSLCLRVCQMFLEFFQIHENVEMTFSSQQQRVFRQMWRLGKTLIGELLTSPLTPADEKEFTRADAKVAIARMEETMELLSGFAQGVNIAHQTTIPNPVTDSKWAWSEEEWGKAETKFQETLSACVAKLAEVPD